MGSRSLRRRVADLARHHRAASGPAAARAATAAWWEARQAAFLGMIPADLRAAVATGFDDPLREEDLSEWALCPFTRWATVPAGYQFPRALVEWVLARPRGWFLGYACGRCGLKVPLLSTWANDPDPPPSIVVFPACPACGGVTSTPPRRGPGRPREHPPPARTTG